MNKNFNIGVIGFFSIFILIFGVGNYLRTSEKVFLFFTIFYFVMYFILVVFLSACNNLLKKIVEIFPGIWCLILILEIIYFIALICLKLFYKKTSNSGIYLADIFVFILCGCIVSCHYCWCLLRELK
jgi:hypothetical protein